MFSCMKRPKMNTVSRLFDCYKRIKQHLYGMILSRAFWSIYAVHHCNRDHYKRFLLYKFKHSRKPLWLLNHLLLLLLVCDLWLFGACAEGLLVGPENVFIHDFLSGCVAWILITMVLQALRDIFSVTSI